MSVADQINRYLGRFTVGIAGCGGLGSNSALALARAGVGRLIIVDFGIVTTEDINKQYYLKHQNGAVKVNALRENIHLINPEVIVNAFDIKLCVSDIIELYSGCDIIVEAFDKAEMKHMMQETVRTKMSEKILVTANGATINRELPETLNQHSDTQEACENVDHQLLVNLHVQTSKPDVAANTQAKEVLDILLKDFQPKA